MNVDWSHKPLGNEGVVETIQMSYQSHCLAAGQHLIRHLNGDDISYTRESLF